MAAAYSNHDYTETLLAYGSFVIKTKDAGTADILDLGTFVTPGDVETAASTFEKTVISDESAASAFEKAAVPEDASVGFLEKAAVKEEASAGSLKKDASPDAARSSLLSEKASDAAASDSEFVLEESVSVPIDDFFDDATNSSPGAGSHVDLHRDFAALQKEKESLKKRQTEEKKAEALRLREEKRATKVPHPIGVKLISIISAIIIIALGGVTYLVSYFITQDIRMSAEENNLAINTRTASDCENRITSTVSSVTMLIDLLHTSGESETEAKSVENLFFDRNKDIAGVYLPVSGRKLLNYAFFASHEIEESAFSAYVLQEQESVREGQNGNFVLLNASPFFNVPLIAICYPVTVRGGSGSVADNAVFVLYSTESMGESFSSGSVNQSFFINNSGDVLVHSDIEQVMSGAWAGDLGIVSEMQKSTQSNRQITYRDDSGEEYIGAFRKLPEGNGAVITLVKTAVVLEGINATTRRNVYITIAILALTVMVVYLFAKSLSVPLKKLTAVVNEINSGNFNTELFSELHTTKSKDEIGVLTKSTQNEREILNTFTKLTNKGVTKAIITKAIDFEPHLKDITIFFSDIRGFTAISDGFKNRFGEKSAGEIISFLNDYMSRMVTCITKTGGTVDKFEGDAIMAAWGVLRNEGLEWENMDAFSVTRALKKEEHDRYVREDALSAVTACIAMRYSLMKYNKDAEAFTRAHKDEPLAQYKPHIRIGAGLNSGRATVGFMGSFDKMEYTSIGDAVNFASRTEASNKPCGTDILITEDTLALLSPYIRSAENNFTLDAEHEANEIIVEQIPVEFEVKGKGKQHFYGVVNMPHFDVAAFFSDDPTFVLDEDCAKSVGPAGPRTLSEMRLLLGIPEPDFGGVNLDAEENKIQVAAP